MRPSRLFLTLTLALLAPTLFAQTPPPHYEGVRTKEDWPQVHVNVLVLDRAHLPVSHLDLSSFMLLHDSAQETIESLAGFKTPISLCILVDGSASSKAVLEPIKNAAMSVARGLPPGSEVTISEFADQAYLDLPFTPASDVSPSAYQRFRAKGGTALLDALIAAEDYFQSHAKWQRRAMVLITDGSENASAKPPEEVVQTLLAPDSPILYVLRYPDQTNPASPRQEERNKDRLDQLSRNGGGLVYSARNADDIVAQADKISEALRSQYALTYTSPAIAGDQRLHTLEVRIPQDKKLKIYGLPAYYAPSR